MVLPRPLSHSSISMYAECPQKYKFRYIDGIPEKPKSYFSFGNSVHQALEFLYGVPKPPPPPLEEVLKYYREHWVRAGYKDAAQEADFLEKGRLILEAFYRKNIESFAVPLYVEYQFKLEVDGVPVTGKVDRVDRLPDGRLSILDYKTGKEIPSDRVATDSQLTMYQLACERMLGADVGRLTFYHLPSQAELTIERHAPALVETLRKRIVDTAGCITRGEFEPLPEERKCFWCDYKPICPVFRHQMPASKTAAVPVARSRDANELSELIDRYGEARARTRELETESAELREAILAQLRKRGYVRAFGKKFELSIVPREKWEFSDKKAVLDMLRKAGLYEDVLAPSAPLVAKLMEDPELDATLRARLEALGEKVDCPGLDVKALSE